MPKKRTPVAERQQESGTSSHRLLRREVFRITGRIPGLVPGPERVLTCGRWVCEDKATRMPALKDKLDTNGERTGRL
jgi:hypothetical protein